MRISDVKIFQYKIPLRSALILKGQELKYRQGLVLQLTNEDSIQGLGEIAPLPGMSSETLKEAQEQLISLATRINDQEIPPHLEQLNGGFAFWLNNMMLYPSVKFGLESAILNLIANTQNIPLAKLIHKNYDQRVAINGLLYGSKETIVDQAKEMLTQGYHAIKLKIGSPHLEDEIAKVHAVNDIIQHTALFRLDVNQAWSFEQALQFCKSMGSIPIEYIEEPFNDTSKIPEFYRSTKIPVALDESINTLNFEIIESIKGVKILIIKPMILGGIEQTCQLIQKADQAGIQSVLSSSFETGLGLGILVNIAAGIPGNIPMGFDTLKWFEKDLLINPLMIENGYCEVPKKCLTPDQINQDLIKEIK